MAVPTLLYTGNWRQGNERGKKGVAVPSSGVTLYHERCISGWAALIEREPLSNLFQRDMLSILSVFYALIASSNNAWRSYMVNLETKKPTCPVCHKSDAIKTLQAAYDQGIARFAPPPMPKPVKAFSMLRTMLFSILIVGVCVFAIIILVGSESFGQSFSVPELLLVMLTLACIVLVLVLSYIAFTRVVRGDSEAMQRYPEWDSALAEWGRLRYCSRDDVVFDPQTNKTLSEGALRSILTTSAVQGPQQSTSLAH
jgi:magnesium-transporting ATPase (P-type)